MPGPHPGRREAGELDRTERRQYVAPQLALVELDRPGPEVRALLKPSPFVVGQGHLPGQRVDPDAAAEIGADLGQVGGGFVPGSGTCQGRHT